MIFLLLKILMMLLNNIWLEFLYDIPSTTSFLQRTKMASIYELPFYYGEQNYKLRMLDTKNFTSFRNISFIRIPTRTLYRLDTF